jgi:hypothetical protein
VPSQQVGAVQRCSLPIEPGLSNEDHRAVHYIEAVGLFGRKEEPEEIDARLDRDLVRRQVERDQLLAGLFRTGIGELRRHCETVPLLELERKLLTPPDVQRQPLCEEAAARLKQLHHHQTLALC